MQVSSFVDLLRFVKFAEGVSSSALENQLCNKRYAFIWYLFSMMDFLNEVFFLWQLSKL